MVDERLSADDHALIDRIKAKVTSGAITTMQAKFGMGARMSTPPPLAEIKWAEDQIGFRLPPLIREIWLQVGNGGFGPGYGITGVKTGLPDFEPQSLVENVRFLHETKNWLLQSAQEALDSGEPEQSLEFKRQYEQWQTRPTDIVYCYWGCNTFTVVDCGDETLPVFWVDGGEIGTHSSRTLRQWWSDWVDGTIQQV